MSKELLIRENNICWICGDENKWNEQLTNLIKDIKDLNLKHEEIKEFWKQHLSLCLIIKEDGIIRYAICKKHLQDQINQL